MEAVFNSLGNLIYNIHGHYGFIIKWKLISPLCKKWSRNREPDMERVKEMIDFYNKGGYIPRMIHLAEIEEEGIVCYDGNHRKEVFNLCNDEEIMCVVDVLFNSTQNNVYKAFNNINKSVQLPAIYIEEQNDDNIDSSVKNEIVNLVRSYETKYKAFLSTSSRCHSPNFNRDTFTDNIYNIYKSFGCAISVSQIGNLLSLLNIEYSKGKMCSSHSYHKQQVIDKCKKYNMWLFIEKTIPFEHIDRLFNE